MIGFIAIFCLKQIQLTRSRGSNFYNLSETVTFLAGTFQTNGYLICQYRFYIQVDISQTLFSLTPPNQFITCIYFQRIATQTPTGKFHANFIHTGRTFQTISYPCTVQSAIILPFTQFIIIETFYRFILVGSGNRR